MDEQLDNKTQLDGQPVHTQVASIDSNRQFTQEELGNAVSYARKMAYTKGLEDAERTKLSPTSKNVDPVDLDKKLEEIADRKFQEKMAAQKKAEETAYAQQIEANIKNRLDILEKKVDLGNQSNPEYGRIYKELDVEKNGALYLKSSEFDNGHDILLHFTKNKDDLIEIKQNITYKSDEEIHKDFMKISEALKNKDSSKTANNQYGRDISRSPESYKVSPSSEKGDTRDLSMDARLFR